MLKSTQALNMKGGNTLLTYILRRDSQCLAATVYGDFIEVCGLYPCCVDFQQSK